MGFSKIATEKNRGLATLIITGLVLGIVSVYSPGAVFDIFLAGLAIFAISFMREREEKAFLTKIFLSGIIIRIALLLAVQFILITKGSWVCHLGDKATALFGDDGYYTLKSWWMAQYFMGKPLGPGVAEIAFNMSNYTYSGHSYLVALFYYLFGYSPVSVIFLNCLFSVLGGVTYYFIAKEIATVRAARITAVLVTFFPSLITWSIVNLKDPLFILLTGIILWAFVRSLCCRSFIFLAASIAALALQYFVRPTFPVVSILVAAILGICYFVAKKNFRLLHLILLVVVLSIGFLALRTNIEPLKAAAVNHHRGVVSFGGFTYRIYDDWVYDPGTDAANVSSLDVARAIPKSWLHFFLEPFPWNARSCLSFVAMPQIALWYVLIPFSILGLFAQLKRDWRKNLVFALYFFIMGTLLSMTGGNIGTVFRIRDVLTPIVLMFSSVGILNVFNFRSKGRQK